MRWKGEWRKSQKLTQKLSDKIKCRKYEQVTDEKPPKVKRSNASVYKQLFYTKFD